MTSRRPVTVATVTRLPRAEFVRSSLLARSLAQLPPGELPKILLHEGNAPPAPVLGLAEAYNAFLDDAGDDDILAFVHDDVFIHDWFFQDRLREAITRFHVVGLAGHATPEPGQPSWALRFSPSLDPLGWQERAGMSGAVGHGDPAAPSVSVYGPTPASCLLLDGLFLAIDVGRVRAAGVAFDPRFRFHGYDLDFCRAAASAGLRIGTWPIAVTHASGGNFTSPAWKEGAAAYLAKWR